MINLRLSQLFNFLFIHLWYLDRLAQFSYKAGLNGSLYEQ